MSGAGKPAPALDPTVEILLGCLRGPEDAARVLADHQAALDWRRLMEVADQNNVLPLLYPILATPSGEPRFQWVPEVVARELMTHWRCNRLRNRLLVRQLFEVLDLLAAGGVEAMTFKGPVLAQLAYGELGARESWDIDILVRPADRARGAALLAAGGYHSLFSRPGEAETNYFLCCADTLERVGVAAQVDFHWNVNPEFFEYAPAAEDLFARARVVEVEGRALRFPGDEDLMLVLCAHGTRDGWMYLKSVCDVAQLLRARPLDWEVLLTRASALHARRILLLGVYMAAELLAAPLPQAVRTAAAREPAVLQLTGKVREQIGRRMSPVREFMVSLGAIERGADKLRYLRQRLLAPTLLDYSLQPLPRRWFFCYRLLHPMRIVAEACGAVVRAAR